MIRLEPAVLAKTVAIRDDAGSMIALIAYSPSHPDAPAILARINRALEPPRSSALDMSQYDDAELVRLLSTTSDSADFEAAWIEIGHRGIELKAMPRADPGKAKRKPRARKPRSADSIGGASPRVRT